MNERTAAAHGRLLGSMALGEVPDRTMAQVQAGGQVVITYRGGDCAVQCHINQPDDTEPTTAQRARKAGLGA